jgi:Concanavalin A-like lectin/glucanases superfamily
MYCYDNSNLNNVTFWGNNDTGNGGGMVAGSTNIKNSIFWGNTAGGTTVSSIGGTPTVTNSDVEGGYAGTGNINQDPLFVNAASPAGADGVFGTADDGLALTACSAAINTGNNTGVATTDIANNPRIFGSTVDMGAYEFQSSTSSPLTIGAYPPATIRQCLVMAQTLTASATGLGTITVQWQRKRTTDLDYVNIGTSAAYTSGTNATYTTAPLSNVDFGVMFRAVFSNSSCTAQTTPVTIYAVVPPQTTTNNALNFDGVNDCVQIYKCSGNIFAGGDAITIEYWFKGSSNQSAVRFYSYFNFIIAGWNGTHTISTDQGAGRGISVGSGYTDGNWHHIAMTWQKGGLFTSYLDGVQVAQRAASSNPLPSFSAGVYLGSLDGTSEFMNGSLDEVRVWTVARTQAQIQANMSACTLLDQTGLLMYYRFNHGAVDGSNTSINTLLNSVNATELTGILNGFNLSTTSSNWVTGKSCTGVLPIELLDFKGTPQYNGNFLTWTTANEVNNKGFQVERSLQPPKGALTTWESIGFVNAKGKAAPPSGTGGAYYRVRSIDNDGTESLSKIVSITRKATGSLKVYPSIATNYLNVETDLTDNFSIINALGQVQMTGKITNYVDINALSVGVYIFKVGQAQVKFVKQ